MLGEAADAVDDVLDTVDGVEALLAGRLRVRGKSWVMLLKSIFKRSRDCPWSSCSSWRSAAAPAPGRLRAGRPDSAGSPPSCARPPRSFCVWLYPVGIRREPPPGEKGCPWREKRHCVCPVGNCGAEKVFAMKSILKTIGEVSLGTRDKIIERPQETANTYPLAFTISASKYFTGTPGR